MSEPIRVVVVDDSPTQRAHLIRLLEHEGDIEVVAEAGNRAEAIESVLRARPDVITMDLEMPGTLPGDELAGIRAVRTIMAIAPTPILVVSAHTATAESTAAIESLAAGAAEVRPRPQDAEDPDGSEIRERVRVLSGVTVVTRRLAVRTPARKLSPGPAIVALGASTGGPPALGTVIAELRGIPAPLLVVQHIHPDFVMSFTGWLERETGMPTHVAQNGEKPLPGNVYVAPARKHLRVSRHGHLTVSPQPEALHRPSVDELFDSLAAGGQSVVAALLTGMGEDGARGLSAIREAGGLTLAQDEDTSAVYGMPRAAARLDEGHEILPLERIGPSIRLAVAGEDG